MMKLMNLLTYSCRKSTELMEKRNHVKLGPVEKIKLLMHTSMCSACHLYEKQIQQLEIVMKKQAETPDRTKPSDKTLSPTSKTQIFDALDKL